MDHGTQVHKSCKWNAWEHLSIDGNLIVHGCRLLIPTTMQRQVLFCLHEDQCLLNTAGSCDSMCAGLEYIMTWTTSCKKCQDMPAANTKASLSTSGKIIDSAKLLPIIKCTVYIAQTAACPCAQSTNCYLLINMT